MDQPERIYRHGEPSKYDQFPEGTECYVERGHKVEIYVQINQNEEDPIWELVNALPDDDERLVL